MYLKHFDLKTKPFELTSDPKFLWLGEKHKEAYALLRYGVLENKGLLLLTGDVGVGKTTLIRALANEFPDEVVHTIIEDPGVAVMDFFRCLAKGFGLSPSFSAKGEFISAFRSFLQESHRRGKRVLLIIDEAQTMETRLLEEVRLLSNIEEKGTKLVNVFFVGQTEFLDTLELPRLRALRHRITLSYTIEPLDLPETYRYIASRLSKAGARANCFTKAAIGEIHMFSGGSPRMINVLCDMAMVVGYSKGVTRLEKQTVREGARQVPGTRGLIRRGGTGNGAASRTAFQEKGEGHAPRETMESAREKRVSGFLFLLLCLAVTLLLSVGMSWLTLAGAVSLGSAP